MCASTTRRTVDRGGFGHELALGGNEYDAPNRAVREMHGFGAFKDAGDGSALEVIATIFARLTMITPAKLNAERSRGLVDASTLVAVQMQRDAEINEMQRVPKGATPHREASVGNHAITTQPYALAT
jgi:hypothetical protein